MVDKNLVEVRLNANELNMVAFKYMDYPKFLSLVANENIYFARPTEFEDKLDSFIPRNVYIKKLSNDTKEIVRYKREIDSVAYNRQRALVSCWHIGDYESDLMWKTYAKHDGIMIQTTVMKLINLDYSPFLDNNARCIIDKIKYIDAQKEFIKKNNLTLQQINELDIDITEQFFLKNKSFEDEKELRIVIFEKPNYDLKHYNNGKTVKIGMPLHYFIDKIILSPYAPDYYIETLKQTLNKMNECKLAAKIELSIAKQTEKILLQ